LSCSPRRAGFSCGGGGSSTPQRAQTFLAKRAFITNSSTVNGAAVVSIIDATKDLFGNHAMTVARERT